MLAITSIMKTNWIRCSHSIYQKNLSYQIVKIFDSQIVAEISRIVYFLQTAQPNLLKSNFDFKSHQIFQITIVVLKRISTQIIRLLIQIKICQFAVKAPKIKV